MNAPVRHSERRTLPLHALIGRSPRNCRADDADDGIAGLAASIEALGQLHALLVSAHPDLPGKFWIDAGGRRFAALKLLRDQGRIADDHPVECDVALELSLADGTVREIALADNVQRRDLHPTEEYEAYAALVDDGLSQERIAADFHVTVRQVRQRLSLARLAPGVRAAWRAGRLTVEAAIAFTSGVDHAAQEALLGELGTYDPATIRARLRGDAIPANAPEAEYVGLDAYVAAGGRVDVNLFEEFSLCRDGALLKRLVRDKLMRDGTAAIEALGLGAVMLREDIADYRAWTALPREFTLAETDQVDAGLDLAGDIAVNLKAISRKATPEQMVATTLVMYLDGDGPHADVGMVAPRVREPGADPVAEPRKRRAKAAPSPPAQPQAEPAPPSARPLLEAIDKARTHGVVAALVEAPQLALVAAIAALQARANRGPIRIATLERNEANATLPHASFATAFDALQHDDGGRVALRHLADVVAESVVFGAIERDALVLLAAVAGVAPEAYTAAARAAFDYAGYVGALPKDKALDVYTTCGGTLAAVRKLKRDQLTEAVATLARDRGWLPDALDLPPADTRGAGEGRADAASETTSEPPAPLAAAMDDAIADDERRAAAFEAWYADAVVVDAADSFVSALDFFAAYAAVDAVDRLSPTAFKARLQAKGIVGRRRAGVVCYRGIALKDATPVGDA